MRRFTPSRRAVPRARGGGARSARGADRVLRPRPDRGGPTDATLRSPAPSPSWRRAAGFPILAEPTSQLRRGPHDRSLLVTGLRRDRAETAHRASSPELVIRFGDLPTSKPLRQWLAAIDDLDQIVIDPAGDGASPPAAPPRSCARIPG